MAHLDANIHCWLCPWGKWKHNFKLLDCIVWSQSSRWSYSANFLWILQAHIFSGLVLKLLHFAQNCPLSVRGPLTIRARTSGRNFAKFDQRALCNIFIIQQSTIWGILNFKNFFLSGLYLYRGTLKNYFIIMTFKNINIQPDTV